MGLLTSIKAAGGSSALLPAVTRNNTISPTLGLDIATGINPFGITGNRFELYPLDNPQLMREGYKNNHLVFTIADWKARRMAEASPLLYRIKSMKHYRRYLAYVKNEQKFEAIVTRSKALEEIDDENHPILRILANPNERQTWSEFCYAVSVYWDFGNALIYSTRLSMGLNKGQIRKLYPIPPHLYEGENPDVSGYTVFNMIGNPGIQLLGTDVLHLARFDPEVGYMGGNLWGMSKLTPGRMLLVKSQASLQAQAEMLENRGGRWILFPKASQFNQDTNVVVGQRQGGPALATDAIRKKLKQVGGGGIVGNAFEIDGLDLSMNMVDLDVINSEKTNADYLCGLWHLKYPAIFSAQGSTYANADADVKASLRNGVLPDQRLLAQKLTRHITPAFGAGYVIEFDTDVYPELQANKKEISEWCDSVGLSTNERRRLFGWDESDQPGADVILIKPGLQPLSDFIVPTDTDVESDEVAETPTNPKKSNGSYPE